jgi:hypothetical protein
MMGRWRSKLRKAEAVAGKEIIVIPQKDGTVLRFDKEERGKAFSHEAERMRRIWRGEDPGPAHEFTLAQENAAFPNEHAKYQLNADRQPPRGEAS